MELIDTHCHLQFKKLAGDVDGVMKRARLAGVNRMICVGTNLDDSKTAAEIAGRAYGVWAAVGIHPHNAKNVVNLRELFSEMFSEISEIEKLLSNNKVVAVGEIGLDYYKNFSPKEDQLKVLRAQIEAGLPSGLPFVFHVRDAFDDFWPVFDSCTSAGQRIHGVVHSFTSGRKQLEQALSRGLYVSLNGIMTFTKDEAQLAAAREVPLDRLLLETDAPFLTPAPERGQACEPRHVRQVAEFLGELRSESLEELAAATTANAERLFGIGNYRIGNSEWNQST